MHQTLATLTFDTGGRGLHEITGEVANWLRAADIKALLTGNSLTIPVADGRMTLGTWQGVFLAEHRRRPHRRQVVVHAFGE